MKYLKHINSFLFAFLITIMIIGVRNLIKKVSQIEILSDRLDTEIGGFDSGYDKGRIEFDLQLKEDIKYAQLEHRVIGDRSVSYVPIWRNNPEFQDEIDTLTNIYQALSSYLEIQKVQNERMIYLNKLKISSQKEMSSFLKESLKTKKEILDGMDEISTELFDINRGRISGFGINRIDRKLNYVIMVERYRMREINDRLVQANNKLYKLESKK